MSPSRSPFYVSDCKQTRVPLISSFSRATLLSHHSSRHTLIGSFLSPIYSGSKKYHPLYHRLLPLPPTSSLPSKRQIRPTSSQRLRASRAYLSPPLLLAVQRTKRPISRDLTASTSVITPILRHQHAISAWRV